MYVHINFISYIKVASPDGLKFESKRCSIYTFNVSYISWVIITYQSLSLNKPITRWAIFKLLMHFTILYIYTNSVSLIFFFTLFLQPRKIEEIKDFLLTARRKDAKCKYLPSCTGFLLFNEHTQFFCRIVNSLNFNLAQAWFQWFLWTRKTQVSVQIYFLIRERTYIFNLNANFC